MGEFVRQTFQSDSFSPYLATALLVFFFLLFLGVLYYVFTLPKGEIEKRSHLPLEEE